MWPNNNTQSWEHWLKIVVIIQFEGVLITNVEILINFSDSLMNNDVDDFKSQLNFHILPSANPDGYEYSREHVMVI